MSGYDNVVAGSLRLKSDRKIKRKKKKVIRIPDRSKAEEALQNANIVKNAELNEVYKNKTKAEIEFERIKEKRMLDTVLTKAEKSHKQRIIEFNEHLETLTEHFDIQKVSWTK